MISPSRLLGVVLLACSGLPVLLSAGNMEQPARRLLGSESLAKSAFVEAKRAAFFLPAVPNLVKPATFVWHLLIGVLLFLAIGIALELLFVFVFFRCRWAQESTYVVVVLSWLAALVAAAFVLPWAAAKMKISLPKDWRQLESCTHLLDRPEHTLPWHAGSQLSKSELEQRFDYYVSSILFDYYVSSILWLIFASFVLGGLLTRLGRVGRRLAAWMRSAPPPSFTPLPVHERRNEDNQRGQGFCWHRVFWQLALHMFCSTLALLSSATGRLDAHGGLCWEVYEFWVVIMLLIYVLQAVGLALQMEQEVLAARTEALGARHPDTLATQGSMAVTLKDLGKFEEALQMEQEVLAARTEALGASHPDTLATQGNLAVTLKDLGKFEEALQMEQEVLAARTEALGASHPGTLTAQANIAVTLKDLGKFEEALQMEQEVLAARTEALGARHPDTLATQGNLAVTLKDLGKFEEALQMQQEVLAAWTEALGARHPDTLQVQGNLANTLKRLGRCDEALQMEQEVLAAQTEALGASHPDTLRTQGNLAATLIYLGKFEEALQMEQEVLAALTEALGASHPDTLATQGNLAVTLKDLGKFEEALQMQQEVLAARTEALGASHPGTLTAQANIAVTLKDLGKFEEALQMEQEDAQNARKPGSRFSWLFAALMCFFIVGAFVSLVLMLLSLRNDTFRMISESRQQKEEVSYINAPNPPWEMPPWGYVKQPNDAPERKIGEILDRQWRRLCEGERQLRNCSAEPSKQYTRRFRYAMPQLMLFYSLLCGCFGLFTVAYFCSELLVQDVGSETVMQMGELVKKGVDVYLLRSMPVIFIVVVVVASVVWLTAGGPFVISMLVGASSCMFCANLGTNMNFEGGPRLTHARSP
eukprot:s1780_g1.t1